MLKCHTNYSFYFDSNKKSLTDIFYTGKCISQQITISTNLLINSHFFLQKNVYIQIPHVEIKLCWKPVMSRVPGENHRSAEIDRLNQIMIDGNISVSDVIGSKYKCQNTMNL